ncbi:hypothetical protein M8J77_019770 [Diaphorina citri]|nr:hypothetical protein M8J77_019770 [Diaphorina citri]
MMSLSSALSFEFLTEVRVYPSHCVRKLKVTRTAHHFHNTLSKSRIQGARADDSTLNAIVPNASLKLNNLCMAGIRVGDRLGNRVLPAFSGTTQRE